MKPTTAGVAVVSGAGSGIGREVALALAQRGHRLALLGRRGGAARRGSRRDRRARAGARGRRPRGRFGRRSGGSDRSGSWGRSKSWFRPPASRASRRSGAAGRGLRGHRRDQSLRRCQPLPSLPAKRWSARRRGHLLPILSVASRKGFPSWTAYCASKWGLAGLVEALREELRGERRADHRDRSRRDGQPDLGERSRRLAAREDDSARGSGARRRLGARGRRSRRGGGDPAAAPGRRLVRPRPTPGRWRSP